MPEVIVAGHLCLDIIPDLSSFTPGQFDASFKPGRLVQSGPAALTTGGAVSNTGIALHRLGVDTRLIARTGEDPLGLTLRQCVEQQGAGLASGLISKAESTTSYSIVISPPDVDRRFLHNPGANDDFASEDVSDEALSQAKLMHFGYPPLMANMYAAQGAELSRLFQRAKSFDLTTSLDMAYPDPDSPAGRADWLSILRNTLPYVDIFTPSFDEISYMLWKKTDIPLSNLLLTKASSILLGMGAKMVLIKLGSRGLYLRTAGSSVFRNIGKAFHGDMERWPDFKAWMPCFKVNVVGTTGAGDVTVAGFLAGLLHGLSPQETMTAALAAGACCVEAADSLSGIRSWDTIWQRVQAGWESRPEPESTTLKK
jgi:sugar/nucleoside kinase (ribokinase family)